MYSCCRDECQLSWPYNSSTDCVLSVCLRCCLLIALRFIALVIALCHQHRSYKSALRVDANIIGSRAKIMACPFIIIRGIITTAQNYISVIVPPLDWPIYDRLLSSYANCFGKLLRFSDQTCCASKFCFEIFAARSLSTRKTFLIM